MSLRLYLLDLLALASAGRLRWVVRAQYNRRPTSRLLPLKAQACPNGEYEPDPKNRRGDSLPHGRSIRLLRTDGDLYGLARFGQPSGSLDAVASTADRNRF